MHNILPASIIPELEIYDNFNLKTDIASEGINDLQSLLDDLRDDEIFLASDAHITTGSQS